LLQIVSVEVMPYITDTAVQDILRGLRNLAALNIGGNRKISNVAFQVCTSDHYLSLVHQIVISLFSFFLCLDGWHSW
jgi:hypothetical protein